MRIDQTHLAKLAPHVSTLTPSAAPAARPTQSETPAAGQGVLPPKLSGKVAELRARLQSLDSTASDARLSVVREKIVQGHYDSSDAARQTAEAMVARWFGAAS